MNVNFVGPIYVEKHAIAGIAPKFGITIHMDGWAKSIIQHGGCAHIAQRGVCAQ